MEFCLGLTPAKCGGDRVNGTKLDDLSLERLSITVDSVNNYEGWD